jgi:hypothetical protein
LYDAISKYGIFHLIDIYHTDVPVPVLYYYGFFNMKIEKLNAK